ncbi:Tat pathway signal protein [Gymnodinialimonas ceratoperidinii]|uniref:Tat pathway signal protein n=1 Tax=Gymnodinialimonas ceratoperidinii TaxID=2856823 RepID=A0A8F6TXV6_9RHOB|nr:Tat pathway signal protein [Gymnodinialimonas ceratoperidinii]QXT40670.1 Tat pathway signal protein [Gymnodinialimonas ceratoperidinii]
MTQTRRQFLALSVAAATAARLAPTIATRAGGSRRVLTLVYDKSLGMMRAIDRLVP